MKVRGWAWACGVGLAAGLGAVAALRLAERRPTPTPVSVVAEDASGPDAEAVAFAPGETRAPHEPPPAAPGAKPPRGEGPPFAPAGETLVYDVAWTAVSAGTITTSVKSERDAHGATVRHIVAEGRVAPALAGLYPLYYKAEALVDPRTTLPRQAWMYQQEGRRRRTRLTVFDHAARRARFEQVGGRRAELAIPAEVWDSLSALYALRAAPELAPGARLTLPICDSGRVYTAELSVGATEEVGTPLGRFAAHRIMLLVRNAAGEPDRRPISLWLSSDARRLPVRIEIELAVGSFKILLREARNGGGVR